MSEKKPNIDNLKFHWKGSPVNVSFSNFDIAFNFFNKIRDDIITPQDPRTYQNISESNLNEIKRGKDKNGSNKHRSEQCNTETFCKAQE